jgi:hypothetical protein
LAPLVPTLGGILFDVYLLIFNELMLEIVVIFLLYCENGLNVTINGEPRQGHP